MMTRIMTNLAPDFTLGSLCEPLTYRTLPRYISFFVCAPRRTYSLGTLVPTSQRGAH